MQSLRRKLDPLGLSLGDGTQIRPSLASTRRRPILITIAALALLSLITSWWIGMTVMRSTREMTRESLQTVLSANVTIMQDWLEKQKASVAAATAMESVQGAANAIIAESELHFGWEAEYLIGLQELDQLQEELRSDEHLGWCIANKENAVIASSIESLVGQTLPIPDPAYSSFIDARPTILLPFESPVPIEPSGPLSIPKCPIMGAMAPIFSNDETDGNKVSGALILLLNPLDRFSKLMSVSRNGYSGETYAFNHEGVLLTQSPFDDQLRQAGILPEEPDVVSTLNVVVRDPGVNVAEGNLPTTSPSEQRLTVMADHATRGGSGQQLMGYRDYRGAPVVGAWTWLPDYQMGVATEIDLDVAHAPFRWLKRGCYALISLMTVSVLGLLLFVWKASRVKHFANSGQSSKSGSNRRRFGRYELGEMLGSGGMGSVYHGKHELLRRPVAIKILASDDTTSKSGTALTGSSASIPVSSMSADSITRFEREVQLTASLRHPNTIDVYDYGRADDGTFFYVMEFVDGITLQQLVDEFGAQPPARVIHLLLQICGSLREAHLNGLVHRDVKPANILLTSEAGVTDWIKVLDFGLIKSITTKAEDQALTQSDTITGTPMYMSPECVRDATESDALSDLYSLGAVGYALLTGKPIFDGSGSVDICMKQLNEEPIRPEIRLKSSLPDDLQNVLMSCLRKDPKDRPQGIDQLASALRSCDDAQRWTEADAIHWWEVIYTEGIANRAIDSDNPTAMSGSPDHVTLDNEA